MNTAYCLKCKSKVAILEGKLDYYANGTPVEKGKCGNCGSKLSRILSREERVFLRDSLKTTKQEDTPGETTGGQDA